MWLLNIDKELMTMEPPSGHSAYRRSLTPGQEKLVQVRGQESGTLSLASPKSIKSFSFWGLSVTDHHSFSAFFPEI